MMRLYVKKVYSVQRKNGVQEIFVPGVYNVPQDLAIYMLNHGIAAEVDEHDDPIPDPEPCPESDPNVVAWEEDLEREVI